MPVKNESETRPDTRLNLLLGSLAVLSLLFIILPLIVLFPVFVYIYSMFGVAMPLFLELLAIGTVIALLNVITLSKYLLRQKQHLPRANSIVGWILVILSGAYCIFSAIILLGAGVTALRF
ncbi:MAG TPA: hypothetical protein VNG90_03765 [Candidatus Acidoferrum sp.]|nr:hypothetical protein [Candidatus Acidoferrum sp.]